MLHLQACQVLLGQAWFVGRQDIRVFGQPNQSLQQENGKKETEVDLNGLVAKVAIAHILSNASIVLDKIRCCTPPIKTEANDNL